ncbi:MAG: hypothetical protein Rsou_1136 [Candidatus Ruthia sp. Asou_11_S2]|nr:hypothetical protein [Candidatus Ruthia sp. Asou_11_S2]
MVNKQSFSYVLKQQRSKVGLSQEKLAEKANLLVRYISLLECDRQQPSLTTFIKIARALETSPSELIDLIK